MAKENFLYFAEAVVETGDDNASEALCVPASSYIGADPISATETVFLFKNACGLPDGMHKVVLTHGSANNKTIIKNFTSILNANPSTGFVVVADAETGTAVSKNSNFNSTFGGDVTAVAITTAVQNGVVAGHSGATTLSTSYGTGVVGSAGAPQYSRVRVGDIIITTVKIDLAGLGAKGGNAGDAIGTGTTPAYFYKNIPAENGIIFKQSLVCLETTAVASGTTTDDINVAWNSAATIDYDEAAGTGSEINAGAMAAGAVIDDLTAAITANHYAYLTEGSTEASDAVFNAGQYALVMYGMATFV